MEFNKGVISDAQRNAANSRLDEFHQVQTIFTLLGPKLDEFKSSYLNSTPSPDTEAVMFRFFEAAEASEGNDGILVAGYDSQPLKSHLCPEQAAASA